MEGELLTKPATYDFEDSNIALLGSDLEKRVREQAGEHEPAWQAAELGNVGLLIWRVEMFQIKSWPKERYGQFFSGDSYIVLHTYKKDPNADTLSYDLHFWLGEETTQDEAGTAAYKTAELDDVLKGVPVQYREVMGHETVRFLSYFKHFIVQRGGVATGFHHVGTPPPDTTHRLYRVHAEMGPAVDATGHGHKAPIIVREVDPKPPDVIEGGDVYILDKGTEIWQLNTTGSVGKEKFKGAEFARSLADHPDRRGVCDIQVFEQGTAGAIKFVKLAIGTEENRSPDIKPAPPQPASTTSKIYRLSDAEGKVSFGQIQPAGEAPTIHDLTSADTYIVDCTGTQQPIFVWIGSQSSAGEKRLAIQYATRYLHELSGVSPRTPIVKLLEGSETDAFKKALGA